MYRYTKTTDNGQVVKVPCNLSDMNLADCVTYAREALNQALFARNVIEARSRLKGLANGAPTPGLAGAWQCEVTDTFGGEANYSWVRRANIPAFADESQSSVMRRAKEALGIAGLYGRTDVLGDGYIFKPTGVCQIAFVTYTDNPEIISELIAEALEAE